MAIKFVDIEPEGEGKPKRSEKATAPQVKADVPTAEELGVSPLPYAKAAPKSGEESERRREMSIRPSSHPSSFFIV